MKCTSDAQIAVLSVRSRSSPGPGTGSGVSRTSSRPPRSTTARMASSLRADGRHAHHRVPAAGDLPALAGADELVIVVADRLHAALVVGRHEHRVDVAAGDGVRAVPRHRLVGDAVQRVPHAGVRPRHEVGDRIDAFPGADVAVVGVAVLGEAGAEELPVAPVDAGRVADEHVGDVLPDVAVARLGRHGVSRRGPIAPALALTMKPTASLRDRPPRNFAPWRTSSPTRQVGPFERCSSASRTTSSALAAPGIGASGRSRWPRRSRRRRSAGVSVSPRMRPSTSTPFGFSSVQRASANTMSKAFEAPYATMFGAPAKPAPEPRSTIPPRPRATIGPAKWWHTCSGTTQLRCTIASAVSTGWARKGSKFGSAPAQ